MHCIVSETMKNAFQVGITRSVVAIMKLSIKHRMVITIYPNIKYYINVVLGVGGNLSLITGINAI